MVNIKIMVSDDICIKHINTLWFCLVVVKLFTQHNFRDEQ